MKDMKERITSKEQELRELKERHRKTKTRRKREEVQRAKSDEVRRKLLAGAVCPGEGGPGRNQRSAVFVKWLDSVLTQQDDRCAVQFVSFGSAALVDGR